MTEIKKRGRGRPKTGDPKGSMFSLRLTSGEQDAVHKAAEAAGLSPTAWARKLLTEASASFIRKT